MPIATPEVYAEMLDRAKAGSFAYPAINCTSPDDQRRDPGFAEAGSDGIVQVSTGGAEFASGQAVKDMVTGAVALAEFAHVVAEKYDVNIALHTDHCPKDKLDGYVRPLIDLAERVAAGRLPLFQSHMWDGSAVPLAREPHDRRGAARQVPPRQHHPGARDRRRRRRGGRRQAEIDAKLYSTPEDALATAEALGLGERGRYLLAATFGNVHGVYKPGNVKLRPRSSRRSRTPSARSWARQGQAVRPRLPRRLGLAARGDPRGARLRRREDERRHRHPVRLHPAGRRPHVQPTTTAC
jgi:fructose-bisphosphate aldolase class II